MSHSLARPRLQSRLVSRAFALRAQRLIALGTVLALLSAVLPATAVSSRSAGTDAFAGFERVLRTVATNVSSASREVVAAPVHLAASVVGDVEGLVDDGGQRSGRVGRSMTGGAVVAAGLLSRVR